MGFGVVGGRTLAVSSEMDCRFETINGHLCAPKISLTHKEMESGRQSGRELDLYPSNPGSTPARVPNTKKKMKNNIKTAQCAFHDLESQGILKKKFKVMGLNPELC